MVIVDLSEIEEIIVSLAEHRRLAARMRGQKCQLVSKNKWACEVNGLGAEVAVAKYLGIFFLDNVIIREGFKHPDLGQHYHVRWTSHETGGLWINPNDGDGIYYLVTGLLPLYQIIGAIKKDRAMGLGLVPNDSGAIVVPRDKLVCIGASDEDSTREMPREQAAVV